MKIIALMISLALALIAGGAWVVLDRVESKWRKPLLVLMTGGWVWYGGHND